MSRLPVQEDMRRDSSAELRGGSQAILEELTGGTAIFGREIAVTTLFAAILERLDRLEETQFGILNTLLSIVDEDEGPAGDPVTFVTFGELHPDVQETLLAEGEDGVEAALYYPDSAISLDEAARLVAEVAEDLLQALDGDEWIRATEKTLDSLDRAAEEGND